MASEPQDLTQNSLFRLITVWSLCTFSGLESLDIETGMGLQHFMSKCSLVYVRFSMSGSATFLLVVSHRTYSTPQLVTLSMGAVAWSVGMLQQLSGSRKVQEHGARVAWQPVALLLSGWSPSSDLVSAVSLGVGTPYPAVSELSFSVLWLLGRCFYFSVSLGICPGFLFHTSR